MTDTRRTSTGLVRSRVLSTGVLSGVHDIADELFQNVLEGRYAKDAAVMGIDHARHVRTVGLHDAEGVSK